jgi:hypothetical protein
LVSAAASVRVGDRGFLYGWKVGGDSALYVPVSEVELIEECSSVEKLKKAYRLDPPAGEKTTVNEPKTVVERK